MHIKFFYRRNARQVSLMSFKVSSNLFQGDLNRKHKPGISHQQDIEILYESYIKQKVHKRKISSIVKISLNLVSFKWEVWLTIKSGSIHNFLLMEMPVQSPLEFFFLLFYLFCSFVFFPIMLLFLSWIIFIVIKVLQSTLQSISHTLSLLIYPTITFARYKDDSYC